MTIGDKIKEIAEKQNERGEDLTTSVTEMEEFLKRPMNEKEVESFKKRIFAK